VLSAFFRKIGADYHQFKGLLRASLKMDFRQSRVAGGRRSSRSALLHTVLFYFIMSIVFSLSIFPRSDVFGYSFLMLAMSMVMMAFAVVIEFHEIVIHPDDSEILGSRPISSRTYFLAKMANLLFYITILGASLNLVPSVVGIGVAGSRFYFPVVYFLVSWAANLTTAAFIVLLYAFLVKSLPFERVRDVLSYVQIAFTFVLIFSYQFVPRIFQPGESGAGLLDLRGLWNLFAPPAWFASFVALAVGQSGGQMAHLSSLALVGGVLVLSTAFRNISLEYARYISELSTAVGSAQETERKGEGLRGNLIERIKCWFVRDPIERAGFELVSRYLKRDRTLRMRIFPAFGFPLAMLALYIYQGQFSDPFSMEKPFGTIFPLVFLVYVAFFFHFILPTCDDWRAAWLYWVVPLESPGKIYWGAIKAIILVYVLPFFILLTAIFSLKMSLAHALLVSCLNLLLFLTYYAFLSLFAKDLPLSRKFERGRSNVRFVFTLIIFPVFMVGGALEYVAFKVPNLMPFIMGGLLLLALFLWRGVQAVLNRRLAGREFLD